MPIPTSTPIDPSMTAAKPAWYRRPGVRTLAIWVLLIALFAGIYAHFEPSVPAESAGYVAPANRSLAAWTAWMPGVVVIGLFAFFMWRVVAGNRAMRAGLVALQDGDVARAEALLAQVAHRYRRVAGVAIAATFNTAVAQARGGRLAAAEASLASVERRLGPKSGGLWSVTAGELARVYALRGDLARARRWLDEAHRRSGTVAGAPPLGILGAEVTVLVREGSGAEALAAFERQEAALGNEGYSHVRSLWPLCAFAAGLADRDPEPWLRKLRPVRPGELAYLAVEWPELGQFFEAHGLGAQVA